MIDNESGTLNNELHLYVTECIQSHGHDVICLVTFWETTLWDHTQPSGSLYSSEAVLSSPQLPPTDCCRCMNIFDFASCVAHGSQAFYEVYNPKCPCAALDTSRKSEGRCFVDAVPLRARIPAHLHSWSSVTLRPSQQVSCLRGRGELLAAP